MLKQNSPRIPTNWHAADTYLGQSEQRKVMHATWLKRNPVNEDIAVQYHATDVVTFHRDGTVTLRDGGYATVSTKRRMNQFTNLHVSQMDWTWYVIDTNKETHEFSSGDTYQNEQPWERGDYASA